jgi:hypothetical protein
MDENVYIVHRTEAAVVEIRGNQRRTLEDDERNGAPAKLLEKGPDKCYGAEVAYRIITA